MGLETGRNLGGVLMIYGFSMNILIVSMKILILSVKISDFFYEKYS